MKNVTKQETDKAWKKAMNKPEIKKAWEEAIQILAKAMGIKKTTAKKIYGHIYKEQMIKQLSK